LGERPFMVGGLALQALGMGWIALIAEPGLTYTEFVLPSVVAGVGVSMAIPAAQNSVVGSFGLEEVGKAAGANSMMRELGGVFGVAGAAAGLPAPGSVGSPPAGAIAARPPPARRQPAEAALAGEGRRGRPRRPCVDRLGTVSALEG